MTVREIIKQYLDEHKFDGLCRDGCGCGKDILFPCGYIFGDCEPGYKIPSPPLGDCKDHDFHIVTQKPEDTK